MPLNRKIFLNSENPRGRRPVNLSDRRRTPQNDNNYHLHVTTCIYAIKPRQINHLCRKGRMDLGGAKRIIPPCIH